TGPFTAIKGIISAFSTNVYKKPIEIPRKNGYNRDYSTAPERGIRIFACRKGEGPLFNHRNKEEMDMSSRVFQSIVLQMKECTDRVIGVIDDQGTVVSCNQLT